MNTKYHILAYFFSVMALGFLICGLERLLSPRLTEIPKGTPTLSYIPTPTDTLLPLYPSTPTDTLIPTQSFVRITAISTGGYHTCALISDGGVMCWGDNESGQLGDGTTINRNTPVEVTELSGVIAIATGYSHTCALTSSSKVMCWGANYSGQLGDGTTIDRLTPVEVSELNTGVVAIRAGGAFTCALISSGKVMCWGNNDLGQLGDGTTTTRFSPVEVAGLNSEVISISADGYHTCAVISGGGVVCWGLNFAGQLGDGTTTDRLTPVKVTGLNSGVLSISTGLHFTCALISNGKIMCWGTNDSGQLGDGTTIDRHSPVEVTGLNREVVAISAGDYHACAITSGGEVVCWGFNEFGELGDSTTNDSSRPVNVTGLNSEAFAISAGQYVSCALTLNGGAYCWGGNALGVLGDGTIINRYHPIPIEVHR
jgi:alpha-tubulin suppressor-like RCC1 family protein